MKKLQALYSDLENSGLCHHEQLAAWIENGEVESASSGDGEQMRFFVHEYTATLEIAEYSGDLDSLLLWLYLWLENNDPEREETFSYSAEVLDHTACDLSVTLNFEETPEFQLDASGQWFPHPIEVITMERLKRVEAR